MAVRLSRQRRLLALLAAGYLVLALDTALEHQRLFGQNWRVLLPPFTALLNGAALGLAALSARPALRRLAAGLLGWSLLVGLAGAWFHLARRLAEELGWLGLFPPPLAPLAFAGLGLLGLTALHENGPAA